MQKSQSTPPATRRRPIKSWGRFTVFVALCGLLLAGALWAANRNLPLAHDRSAMGPALEAVKPLPFVLKQPDAALQQKLPLLLQQPKLRAGIFLVDLQSGAYFTQNDTDSYPAASTIKVPILLALLQDIEHKKLTWNDTVAITKELQVSGSGVLKGRPLGTRLRVWEVADLMITESDNIGTELLINKLGGRAYLNQRFQWWGLSQTTLQAPLPDITGQNRTSPRDLAVALAYIEKGIGLSPWNRDRALDFLHRVVNRSFFVTGLAKVEPMAQIAHKTGTIGIGIGDAGIIDLPNGRRYLLSAMVERPREDRRAIQLLQDIAAQVAQSWSTPLQ